MENSVEQSFLTLNEVFNSYHLGSVFETLFFIISTLFMMKVMYKMTNYVNHPEKYNDNILSISLLSIASTVALQISDTTIISTFTNITGLSFFGSMTPFLFLTLIKIMFESNTQKQTKKQFTDAFDTQEQLIEHLESKEQEKRMNIIMKHKKSIIKKFPTLENHPLFKTDKLVIIEEEN